MTDAHVPAEPAEEWIVSDSEEHWSSSATFESKAAAIAAAGAELDLEPGQKFWVGRKASPRLSGRDWADEICEGLALDASDDTGDSDIVGDWPRPTKEQRAELNAEIDKAIAAWFERHADLQPGFFIIEDYEQHEAPERLADGSPVS